MANPPGVNVTVNTPSSSAQTNSPTGTWFVVGTTAGGPTGAVPVNSIQDFNTYFGTYVNGAVTGRAIAGGYSSNTLYDSLDVYFREGGIRAYVSRVVGAASAKATTTIAGASSSSLVLTANGGGTWSNSANTSIAGIIATVTASGTGYILSIAYNGNTLATSPTLFTPQDAQNWINSLAAPGIMATATTVTGSGALTAGTYYFTGGTDVAPANSDWTDSTGIASGAVSAFNVTYGPGQVSAPGNTTVAVWQGLTNHATALNRVAILDAVDGATAATLTGPSGAPAIQYGGSNAATDSSYAALFAPWVKIPGIASVIPNTIAPTFTRTVPPSPFVAANIAASDIVNDTNVPAAGVVNGSCNYALDVTTTYSASDRATLNTAGVNLIRNINGAVAVYGYRSLALDANWVMLNNVRFRMQILRDMDVIAEPFVFAEIDGKGQVFARLAGALSGQCQNYWLRGSIYGLNPEDAFNVNVGPQINNPTTIAAGQINAQVNLRMAPQAELVSVTVTKYLVSATLPAN